MPRVIPLTELAKGIQNDNPQPGTMRECVNLLPWRGSLRRRGPISRSTNVTSPSALSLGSPAESVYADNLRFGAAALCMYPISGGASFLKDGASAVVGYSPTISPVRLVGVQDEIWILMNGTGSARNIARFNGASGSYAAGVGTVTSTAGSKTITFSSSADCASACAAGYVYTSTTCWSVAKQLTGTTALLDAPAPSSVAAAAVSWAPLGVVQCSPSPALGGLFGSANAASPNYVSGAAACEHQLRAFVGNISDREYSAAGSTDIVRPFRIRWSALPRETDSGGFQGKYYWNADAFMDLPDGGGEILGLVSFNGALVAIRRKQVDVISGAFATNGSDLGAQVNTVLRNAGAGGFSAWEQFEGGIAFADEKGVYVWDGEKVTNLTRGAIERVYRQAVGPSAARLVVSCPGNRIMVWVDAPPARTNGFVFDLGVGGWFRIELDGAYGRICDTGSEYVAPRNERFDLGGGSFKIRTYNIRKVFEDLDTSSSDRALDQDPGAYSFTCYALFNPVPLADGWAQGRVTEVVIADGGLSDDSGLTTYRTRLLRGALYSSDSYSGESDLLSQELSTYQSVPQITGASATQRAVKVRTDGSNDATHAMLELELFTSGAGTVAYGLNAVALVVDDNPNYQSA